MTAAVDSGQRGKLKASMSVWATVWENVSES